MTKVEYFKYVFMSNRKNDLVIRELAHLNWYFSVFTYAQENEYIFKEGKYWKAKLKLPEGEKIELITDSDSSGPLLNSDLEVKIVGGRDTKLLKDGEEATTTIGRFIVNFLLVEDVLRDKLVNDDFRKLVLEKFNFVNKETSSGPFTELYEALLRDDHITVPEYGAFVDRCSFLQDLSRIFSVVVTEKNVTPPDGLDEFKKKLSAEFDKEYGNKWRENVQIVARYIEKLKDYDQEYLKGDPSKGRVMLKKIEGNARVKMYLTIGMDRSFDPNSPFVEASLGDGMPKDAESLAAIYNSIIGGSFSRGNETVKGGVLAKSLLRAGLNCVVREGDCGTNLLLEVEITSSNAHSFNNRFYLNPSTNKLEEILDGSTLVGRKIKIRSPLYCRLDGKNFCSICVGKAIGSRKFGIPLLLTDIGGTILNSSMKAMHDTSIKPITVTIEEMIK